MTRLDRHVRIAQNKLMLGSFVELLALTLLVAALAAWVVIVAQRLAGMRLPGARGWLIGAVGMAIGAAFFLALLRRPNRHQAAVAIDDRLELREKFSTALFARGSADPFARAAVADAERAAESVALARRFPIGYPRWGIAAVAVAIAAVCTAWWMPTFDVLGIQGNRQKKAAEAVVQRNAALANAKQALMQLESAPIGIADADAVRLARQDLEHLLARPPADATPIEKHVEVALQKLHDAQQHLLASATLSEDKIEAVEAALDPPSADDKGPVADAHRALSQGKLDQAMDSLTQAVDNFSKMTPQAQQQAAQQMSNLAHQIQQQANNPQTQQNAQQQLQKMGASQQQAKQMSQLMQQAAQGNQQAAQQLQQMANQMVQQANSKSPGQSQQQQQQNAQSIQQALGQMQQQANGHAQAQQLSHSAQQLASAMRQAAGQSQTPGNSKPGSAGNKPGASGQQQSANAAGQQMQQALGQLKAMANGSQASAAGQQQNPGGGPQPPMQQARQITSNGYGFEREGLQMRTAPDAVAHKVDPTVAPADTDPSGRLLASSFVKDNAPLKGDSKQTLAKIAAAAEQDTTDEVDEDRIPRSAQNAVKEYFQTLKQDGQQ